MSIFFFFFFLQNKLTAPRLLSSFFRTIIRESALCFRISEIALGFRPMRNGKIFKRIISSYWMRSSIDMENFADRIVCYAPHLHWFLPSYES